MIFVVFGAFLNVEGGPMWREDTKWEILSGILNKYSAGMEGLDPEPSRILQKYCFHIRNIPKVHKQSFLKCKSKRLKYFFKVER